MNRLIRAEVAKLTSLRVLWLAALAGVAVAVAGTALAITNAGVAGNPPLGSEPLALVLGGPSGTLWFMTVTLGVLLSAGEWTHHTVRTTFLVTPRRSRVLAAKLAAAALVGGGVALLVEVAALSVAVPLLGAEGVSVPIASAATWGTLGAVVGVSAAWSMLGVALGSLLRNQTTALVTVLIWMLVVEGFLPVILHQPEIARWLPGSAAHSVLGLGVSLNEHLLAAWAGGLLFLGYVAVFGLGGAVATARAEVR